MRWWLISLLMIISLAQAEPPQYGGELNIGTVYVTLSPLSWDSQDWNWKSNHDTSMVREQLFAADLDLSVKKGGPYRFVADAYLPRDAIRGELAESWRWLDDLTVEVKLRKGVIIPAKPGVIEQRELDAHDIVFSYNNLVNSPKRIADYLDHIEQIEVIDSHTLHFHFSKFSAEWDYRFGYGYYSAINPREVGNLDAKDWRNVVGSGPFTLEQYIQGNSQIYAKNPHYWGKEALGAGEYPIPFVDRLTYRVIKDEATYLTGIRTGRLDILETIRWIAVDHLKKSTPELQWNRWLATSGNFVVLRQDFAPFADVRVRRAMNMAINNLLLVDGHIHCAAQ